MKFIHTVLVILLLVLSCIFAQELNLTILHTNDQHGNFESFKMIGQDGKVGGIPARMTLIKQVKEEIAPKNGSLLILDCGDINTGVPRSMALQAKPDIELMNELGYQAMALGNHEFDFTLDVLFLQRSWAKFPFLSANVFYKENKKLLVDAYKIFNIEGLKIGVFGFTPAATPYISTNGKNPQIYFETAENVLPDLLKELRPQCDFIIGLMHTDHEETLRLAQVFPDIDMILGGHTHYPSLKADQVGKTIIAEAGSSGLMVGRWDLVFQNKKLENWNYELIGINLSHPIKDDMGNIQCEVYHKKFAEDPDILKIIDNLPKIEEELIAEAAEDIGRTTLPSSPLGNLICDAILEQTKSDIAFQNVGGIRSDILKGKFYNENLSKILPFANTIVVFSLSGQQVIQLLEAMAGNKDRGKGLLEVSGMTVKMKGKVPTNIMIQGKPLDLEATYKVAINSFIADGGDGYSLLVDWVKHGKEIGQPISQDTGKLISTVVKEYFHTKSILYSNPEKRIVWEN